MSDQTNYHYPRELYLEIQNNPHLLGRLTLIKAQKHFHVEVDLVFLESKKIYRHINSLYNLSEEQEAIDLAMQKLAKFLRGES
jgi:predicted transcriptional regulator